MSLRNKVVFITGASRGIGRAIALRYAPPFIASHPYKNITKIPTISCARDGARIAIAAKTTEPHPKLPGTIYTAAEDVRKAGGEALPIVCDIRDEDQVKAAIAQTVKQWGGIDILVNNASAIMLTDTENTPLKRMCPVCTQIV